MSDELSSGWKAGGEETTTLPKASLVYLFHIIQTDEMMPRQTALIFARTIGLALRAKAGKDDGPSVPLRDLPEPAAVTCVLTRELRLARIAWDWLGTRPWARDPKAMREMASTWCDAQRLDGIDVVGDPYKRIIINRPAFAVRVSHGVTH